MTVIWPTSWKHEQGKKRGTIAPVTIALEIDLTRRSSRSCVVYVYLLRTLSIQIAKTNLKLLVKMASEQERLTISYILNLLICKIFIRYSKTNTTWFISRSGKNYWSRGVGCVRLLPDAKLSEVALRIQHLLLPQGATPLNNLPIEIHANSSMFALIFWPHVTIFCIFWLHECLKWTLEFNSKSLFWYQSRQIFEVRAIEQRHHEFQLIHMPPHQFWPRYHSDGLSPVHVRLEFFSKQICNVEALICHFDKNIKTLTQIHFPRDAHIFRTCTIFYRQYKGLHQMRKDLVLCALNTMLYLYTIPLATRL